MKKGTTTTFGVSVRVCQSAMNGASLHVGVENPGEGNSGFPIASTLGLDRLGGLLVQARAVADDDEGGFFGADSSFEDFDGPLGEESGHGRVDADGIAVMERSTGPHRGVSVQLQFPGRTCRVK